MKHQLGDDERPRRILITSEDVAKLVLKGELEVSWLYKIIIIDHDQMDPKSEELSEKAMEIVENMVSGDNKPE